ncbi:hypothetical protein J3L16_09210 [Alteromonas sp. 5E99-2]|uniref:energy transducer TonB n=1 Tax=Alteromonas sp. 5E99-2 TaxID=2817683 RepID=UPI001A98033D|nr:hypothetical protein [Alteromonas sp. 5E99-2]MBO1255859.1 hypothetical protein [Alteromonas sp. 5E99-2]
MKHIFVCISYLLLTSLTFPSFSSEPVFSPAKMEDDNQYGPKSQRANPSRNEGWAYIDFVVNKNGKIDNVIIEASEDDYVFKSEQYLKGINYSPAKLGDETVSSSSTLLVDFSVATSANSNDGFNTLFGKRFEAAKALIIDGKLDEARIELDQMTSRHMKNTTERALSAWLHSLYYYGTQDWGEYEASLLEANNLLSKLPRDLAKMTIDNLMKYQVHKKQFSDARDTFFRMENIEKVKLSDESKDNVVAELFRMVDDSKEITVDAVLNQRKTWRHTLNRDQLDVAVVEGELTAAGLYCQNGYIDILANNFETVQVSNDLGKCNLAIQGEPGTSIRLKETGNNRFNVWL